VLEGHHTEIRRKDALLITFFCGIISVTMLFFLIFILMNGTDGHKIEEVEEWAASFPVFRFLLVLVFIVTAAAIDVYIMKTNRVNYQYVFELDPNYRMTQV